jgi:hypothetical protein
MELLLAAQVGCARELAAFEARAAPLVGRALHAETYGALRLRLLRELPHAVSRSALLLAPGLVLRCAPGAGGAELRLERPGGSAPGGAELRLERPAASSAQAGAGPAKRAALTRTTCAAASPAP